MKSVKLMSSGIFLAAAAAFCTAADSGRGTLWGGAGIFLFGLGTVFFVLGLIKKE